MKLFRLPALTLALVTSPGWSQELGLDLTESSESSTPAELRPSLVFLGVVALGPEKELATRAQKAQAAVLRLAEGKEQFSKVMPPSEANTALEPDAKSFARCGEKACLEKIAEKLEFDRVLVGTVGYVNGETRLTLYGFDRGPGKVFVHSADSAEQSVRRQLSGIVGISGKSQAHKDSDFIHRAGEAMGAAVSALKTPLGTLIVRSYDPDVEVRLNGRKVGTGAFSKNVPAGAYVLKAESASVMPFETKVTVEALKTLEVPLTLVAKESSGSTPAAAVATRRGSGGSVLSRPGLYVALAGAVAMGVGGFLGASAAGVQRRAVDANGDGVLDITRAEALSAQRNALIANVLLGAGGAAVAGGGLWVLLTPTVAARQGDEPTEGGGVGFALAAGGSF